MCSYPAHAIGLTLVAACFWLTSCQGKNHISAKADSEIQGRVSPAGAASNVWIITLDDTLSVPLVGGKFSKQLRPDHYRLVVAAELPFQRAYIGQLAVAQGQVLDIGEILLRSN